MGALCHDWSPFPGRAGSGSRPGAGAGRSRVGEPGGGVIRSGATRIFRTGSPRSAMSAPFVADASGLPDPPVGVGPPPAASMVSLRRRAAPPPQHPPNGSRAAIPVTSPGSGSGTVNVIGTLDQPGVGRLPASAGTWVTFTALPARQTRPSRPTPGMGRGPVVRAACLGSRRRCGWRQRCSPGPGWPG